MAETDKQAGGEMPFLEHLEELRWRIIRSLAALAAGFVIGFLIVDRFDVVGILKRPIAPLLTDSGGRLLYTSPTEPLLLTFKLAFVLGVVLAAPVVIGQLWAFLRPALYERERRVVVPVSLAAVALFFVGALLAYYWVLPLALRVLAGFQDQSLAPIITANAYFSFATMVVVAFGVIFELPLLLFILVWMRVLSAAFLRRHRRMAVVANAILSALLTPADLVSMLMMMVPVQLFYELSIVFAVLLERRRAREAAAERAEAAAGA
jgi:sec-independent protein translocase protein TatC